MDYSIINKRLLIILLAISLIVTFLLISYENLFPRTKIVICSNKDNANIYFRTTNHTDVLILQPDEDIGSDLLICLGKHIPFYDRKIEVVIFLRQENPLAVNKLGRRYELKRLFTIYSSSRQYLEYKLKITTLTDKDSLRFSRNEQLLVQQIKGKGIGYISILVNNQYYHIIPDALTLLSFNVGLANFSLQKNIDKTYIILLMSSKIKTGEIQLKNYIYKNYSSSVIFLPARLKESKIFSFNNIFYYYPPDCRLR